MSVVLKYQVSLFVPFQPYTTAADCFKNAFETFFPRGFFPSTIQEQVVGGSVADRLSLVNNTLGINVQFLSNRIDILALPFASPQAKLTLEQFIEEVRALIALVLDVYPVRVERLALMSERMMDNVRAEALDDVRGRFICAGIEEFDEATNIEWSMRRAVRIPLSQDFPTVCNHIYSVSRGLTQFGDLTGIRMVDGLQVALDINTNPTPGQMFDGDSIKLFISQVLLSHNALLGKIERRIHGH